MVGASDVLPPAVERFIEPYYRVGKSFVDGIYHAAVTNAGIKLGAVVKRTELGAGTTVGRWATVTDSDLGPQTRVGHRAIVADSTLAPHADIHNDAQADEVTLGQYSHLGAGNHAFAADIGAYTSTAWDVTIGPPEHPVETGSTHPLFYSANAGMVEDDRHDPLAGDCTVGNDCWIGCGATVLRGVEVGDGAVVAANATVVEDVPPFAVVAGNPAEVVRYRFDEPTRERLLDSRWWTEDPETADDLLDELVGEASRERMVTSKREQRPDGDGQRG